MRIKVERSSTVRETARVLQMRGMFDVQPSPVSSESWDINLPIEDRPWNIGLIFGPSGSGKSTVAREAFGDAATATASWSPDRSVMDDFPAGMSIKEITGLLSSIGFSAPPAWLRPFHVLSTGQQFRVGVARAIAEAPDLAVVDEFTSVVDRQVAQVGSAAVAKAVRRSGKRFVAVSCHYDILDWLQPDWTLDMATQTFEWRSLQQRPRLTLTVRRVHHHAWGLFEKYHYMTGALNKSAHCYVAFLGDRPIAFLAMLYFPHPKAPAWHFSRLVVLPDFQGLGITIPLCAVVGDDYRKRGLPVSGNFAHPAMIAAFRRAPGWRLHPPRSHTRGQGAAGARNFGDPDRVVWRVERTGVTEKAA